MRQALLVGLAAISVAACGQLPFGGVHAPPRKPGLWQQSVVFDGRPAIVTKICYDAATDRRMPVFGRRQRPGGGGGGGGFAPTCSKNSESQQNGQYVADRDCTLPNGMAIASHTVVTGDFQTSYAVTTDTTVSGSPDPVRNGKHSQVMTASFQGACPDSIQPGQVQLPNGDVVDLAQLRASAAGGFGGFGGGRPGGGASNAASNSAPPPAAPANGASQ
jgi:hypothetical protein